MLVTTIPLEFHTVIDSNQTRHCFLGLAIATSATFDHLARYATEKLPATPQKGRYSTAKWGCKHYLKQVASKDCDAIEAIHHQKGLWDSNVLATERGAATNWQSTEMPFATNATIQATANSIVPFQIGSTCLYWGRYRVDFG